MPDDQKLTPTRTLHDFYDAYEAKRDLLNQQRKDYQFRLGKQWTAEDRRKLERRGVLVVTDNRIQANIFLLTGLERQNRTDVKAFPEGREDSVEADIATALLKNSMKCSDGNDKISEMFDAGITVGESYLEMYLDSTYNFLNPKTRWKKLDSSMIFPEPGWKEYDFSDCSYVYKWTRGLTKYDLISLYPEKEKMIKSLDSGAIQPLHHTEGHHLQFKDYPNESTVSYEKERPGCFDLLERYYKKWVERVFLIDKVNQTLNLVTAPEDSEKTEQEIAEEFIQTAVTADPKNAGRHSIIKRTIPEIWVYAITGGGEKPLADERAWFYPKWKKYPFMNYFANWSDADLDKEDRHLNVQGIVRGIISTQELHNKAETLKLRHLNSSANSGWLSEEGAWVDPRDTQEFGSTPGKNLEYKKGSPKPERIFPMSLSGGHELISRDTTEAIKAQLGINADLLAAQQGGTDSGRAIALRQKQGIVMVQKYFDNLSRTKREMGRFTISQFHEIYDVQSVKKVLGEAYIRRTWGQQAMGPDGQPTLIVDEEAMNSTIRKVLTNAELGKYDVTVGEAITSDTKKMADYQELQQFARAFPGLVTPEMLIGESNLPPHIKEKMLSSIQRQQAQAQQAQQRETALNSPVLATSIANPNNPNPLKGGV